MCSYEQVDVKHGACFSHNRFVIIKANALF